MKFSSRYNLLLSISLSSLAAACFVACSDPAETDDLGTNVGTDSGTKKDGSTTVGDDSTGDDDVTTDGSTSNEDGSSTTTDGSTTLTDGSTTVTDGSAVVDGSVIVDSGIDAAKPKHLVKGTVSGLLGTGLMIQNNAGDDLAVSAVDAGSGSFTFATAVSEGAAYAVTVKTQPTGPSQTCTVMSGSGTMGTSDVITVSIACSTNSYMVNGTAKGLTGTGLKLKNNGGDEITVAANGGADVPFMFPTSVASGATYTVTASGQPSSPTQVCVVTNDTGTIGSADVANVTVTCTTTKFTVAGLVTGLTGTGLKLKNNGADEITVDANGNFFFPTKIASGENFAVTVSAAPSAPVQTCTVSANPTGTVGNTDYVDVAVACTGHYPTGSLVAYWNFEQASPTVSDLSGNGNTATVRGAATQAAGKLGKGYNLSGSGQCITVPNNANLSFGGAKAITFMMWTKVTNVAVNQIFFNKENTWESGVNQNGSGTFEYALNANWAWFGNKTLTSGVWQHIATTWDGATVTQYINGSGSFTQAQGGSMTANATGFGMGCRNVAADGTIGGSSFLNGSIDEAFVYSRALTAQEVLDYYNATK